MSDVAKTVAGALCAAAVVGMAEAVVAPWSPNGTLDLPFSWATLPRYTFCGNESKNYTGFPLRHSAVDYIATQGGAINIIGDHSSYRYPAEANIAAQAKVLLARNPAQRQWAYMAIDLVRPAFATNAYMMNHTAECLFKDVNGIPVPRPVYGFDGGAGSCGVEKWLEGAQIMIDGGVSGIFLDGFQGCDPFFPRLPNGTFGVGCTRICGHHPNGTAVDCSPASIARWNAGLRAAMWRLKRMLGRNGTLVCNSTPGPYTCGNAKDPTTQCPCDGTNDERGGGNFDHMEFVAAIDARAGPYAMLTHTPHADVPANFEASVGHFLMGAAPFQYLGSGFAYGCDDGWLSTHPSVAHSFSAPLGPPVAPAAATPGCGKKSPGVCIRTRVFGSGTKVFVNYTGGGSCVVWSDGVNLSTPSRAKVDGCALAATWPF